MCILHLMQNTAHLGGQFGCTLTTHIENWGFLGFE
jgi:hypothetical protein